jgi:type I restriction enzyme, S subunit
LVVSKKTGFVVAILWQPNLNQDALKRIKIPIPPVQEQQSIARFLDQKTAQIDALIEQKEKLLKLLTEKRTAIITQAVTKGLDPKVKMKDSGIEWLGEVPEHWEVWKATHGFLKIGSGTTPKSDNFDYYNGEILWVTTSELRESVITNTTYKVTDLALREYNLRLF